MTTVAARDRYVTLNGLRFHYREWGDPDAPSLTLLHGFTSHARIWDRFAAVAATRWRVLALDLRGHGESEWAASYTWQEMVDDTDAFVREVAGGRSALVGMSMGARNAYTHAGLHPERVTRLVIVDIAPDSIAERRERPGRVVRDTFATLDEAVAEAYRLNPRPPAAVMRHRVQHNLRPTADGRWTYVYDRVLRPPGQPPTRPEPEEVWPLLARITCPTLLVRGAESAVLSEASTARMLAVIPDCRLVTVADSGHPVPLDNPAGFLAAVRPFLEF